MIRLTALRHWLWTLGVVAACVTTSSAQEWTRFRGPNGTGLSDAEGIPTKWTDKDYNWKTTLPAGGHSSPVIWKDLIFLTGADEDANKRSVFAISTETGEVVWTKTYSFGTHRKHKLNSFASPTCAVDEERVYASWTMPEDFSVKAFSHDGKELWSRSLGGFVSQHSGGVSPIVFDDLLIIGNEQDKEGGGKSFLTALDRRSGETVWTLPRESAVVTYSTPCLRTTPEGKMELVFNSTSHGISGVDPISGKILWEVPDLFNKRSVSSAVVAVGDILLGSCGSGGGGNYLVGIKPGSATEPDSGKLLYKVTRQAPYVPTPIAKGDYLFLISDGGIATCVEARTGEIVQQKRIGGTFYGSPICIQDRIYVINTSGDVVVLSATPELEELAVNPLGELSHSTPAVADGRLYLRAANTLYSIGGKK